MPTGHNEIAAMLRGDIAVADANHLLVQSPQGRELLVNLRSGATSTPAPGQMFWCAHANFFKINPPPGISVQRVGSSLYGPCDAAGHAVTAVPSNSVPAIAQAAEVFGDARCRGRVERILHKPTASATGSVPLAADPLLVQ